MAQVFISYAREDVDRASMLARLFTEDGHQVWWDRKIEVGSSFDKTIEEQLKNADAVVVLWTEHSIESNWVRAEASAGLELKKLFPVKMSDCEIPLQFRMIHTADLTPWQGNSSDAAYGALAEQLTSLGREQGPGDGQLRQPLSTATEFDDKNASGSSFGALALIVIATALIVVGIGATVRLAMSVG